MDSKLRTEAVERADARRDFYVEYGFKDMGTQTAGPLSNREQRDLVDRLHLGPNVPDIIKVMRVVEDYCE